MRQRASAGARHGRRRRPGRGPRRPGSRCGIPRLGDDGRRRWFSLPLAGPRPRRPLRCDLQDDQPGRETGLRLPAQDGCHQPDRILGCQPQLLAQPLHARPHYRVVLQRPGRHRHRSSRPRLQEDPHPPATCRRPDLGPGQLRLDSGPHRQPLEARGRQVHPPSNRPRQHDGHRVPAGQSTAAKCWREEGQPGKAAACSLFVRKETALSLRWGQASMCSNRARDWRPGFHRNLCRITPRSRHSFR